jgi:hypothetical protein
MGAEELTRELLIKERFYLGQTNEAIQTKYGLGLTALWQLYDTLGVPRISDANIKKLGKLRKAYQKPKPHTTNKVIGAKRRQFFSLLAEIRKEHGIYDYN